MTGITIFHLYPGHLNLYGDGGNITVLLRRARLHGLEPRLVPVHPGYRVKFEQCDLLYMGGGQDGEQKKIFADLQKYLSDLQALIERGMVVLAVGTSYRLLGRYYLAAGSERIPGLGLLDLYTEPGPHRLTGDLVIRSDLWRPPKTLVGFENHGGRTFLGPQLKPLGTVLWGYGNNGQDRTEGAVYKNLIGTYLHGPLLPKNPHLADCLLARALEYRAVEHRLGALDDAREMEAHRYILRRSRCAWPWRKTPALPLA